MILGFPKLLMVIYSFHDIVLIYYVGCADIVCDPNAFCTSTPGSLTCICNHGYTGDGTTCIGKYHEEITCICTNHTWHVESSLFLILVQCTF